jgi:hypothetical protein
VSQVIPIARQRPKLRAVDLQPPRCRLREHLLHGREAQARVSPVPHALGTLAPPTELLRDRALVTIVLRVDR